jgi:hypothetical protein
MEVVAQRSRGRAVEIIFKDGTKSWYFSYDMAAYRQALESGKFPLDRTFHTAPPKIESR